MNINIPAPIEEALAGGAALVISISGGKDSQAMLYEVVAARIAHQWPGEIHAIHADVGRMEWPQSAAHCQKMCDEVGVTLVTVHRPQGDLLDQIQQRMVKLAGSGKPHWPSAQQRYCTSDQKRAQIDKVLRQHDRVISAEGVRRAESASRAHRPCYDTRTTISNSRRTAFNWRPLIHWSTEDVWISLGTSSLDLYRRQVLYRAGEHEEAMDGWPAHPAYIYGNERVSCALCVLACQNDLETGARHNPELLRELVAMEEESGFSFKQHLRLGSLIQATN